MGDILTQAEIESLLSGMESAPDGGDVATSALAASSISAFSPRSREKATPYDFKRPQRVAKEQIRALQTLHEGLGRNFGVALSASLRAMVEVKLTSVNQLTYSEFVSSLENPTCFNLLKASPLDGNLILDISPSILYPIIDRLLGGGRQHVPVARRPLTEIELRLVSRVTHLFLSEMQKAWENVIPLELAVEKVESNPQLVQVVPPNEVVVLIGFEMVLGQQRGMMNLCIPFHSIEQIGAKLSSSSWGSYGRPPASPKSIRQVGQKPQGSIVELRVQLAETKISTGDMIGLRVGDIITTDKDVNTPMMVSIEGVEKFSARAGAFKGRKAIQIEAPLTDSANK